MKNFNKYLKNIYQKSLDYLSQKNSWKFLGFISFIESIFFPIPPDIILIPMIMADRKKTIFLVNVTTFFSVTGGIFGYLIGFYFWDLISPQLYELLPEFNRYFSEFKIKFNEIGWLIILLGGFTPFPFKVITISCGIMQVNLFLFILFSLLSRGLRFAFIGILMYKFGLVIKKMVEEYLMILTILLLLIIVLYFVVS
tara:strand:+ start:1200 stop:1790 length:591 start_codon:yes stop_codon:yes gene_type:complete